MKIHALRLACLAAFACVPGAYAAQDKAPEKYPGKSISFIVPFVPGGPGYENSSWSAIAGPARMPRPLVARLNKEFVEILKMPDIQQRHAEVGAEIIAGTPEQFHAYLNAELAKFGKLVKASGIRAAAGG